MGWDCLLLSGFDPFFLDVVGLEVIDVVFRMGVCFVKEMLMLWRMGGIPSELGVVREGWDRRIVETCWKMGK